MYLFEADNESELGFKEGEILTLISQIDENWFEGMNDNGEVRSFNLISSSFHSTFFRLGTFLLVL